jgi:hypothetical protein
LKLETLILMKPLLLSSLCLLILLSACTSRSPKSSEPWVFPDAGYRTIHRREGETEWKVWQYQDTRRAAQYHRAFMDDFFSYGTPTQTAIERRAR